MIPDLDFAVRTFARFNGEVFGGALPVPRFALTRARTFRGKLTYTVQRTLTGRRNSDFEIRLSTLFDLDTEVWEDVLLHEMIHLHIAANHLRDTSSHGPRFRALMEGINRRHGRHMAVLYRSSDAERSADTAARAHYICLARFGDGQLCLAVVGRSSLLEFRRSLPLFKGVVAYRWVGSVDSWFNRFPRVRSPKLYRIDERELTDHLRGAVPLEFTATGVRPVSGRWLPQQLVP